MIKNFPDQEFNDRKNPEDLGYCWETQARENQRVPKGNWRAWLILAGRGFGKTRTGAETLRQWVESGEVRRIALIGATEGEVRDVMVEGMSGLLAVHPPHEQPRYEPSKRRITWPNGAIATLFSAENYEQLRGPQFDCAWIDELCKLKYAEKVWDQLNFSLRLGKDPKVILTTTPRPIPLLKELLKGETKGDVYVTRGSTFENIDNLSGSFISYVEQKYKGTKIGKQELYGQVLDSAEGALWTQDLATANSLHRAEIPELLRVIVAIDPAVTSNENSDETGIIVAGKDDKGHAYILDDVSGKYSPNGWAELAVETYDKYQADAIVAEVNQGGDLVESIVESVAKGQGKIIPYRGIHATRGKVLRAEPVVALYEQRRVHHLKTRRLEKLEEQMSTYVPKGRGHSPDRIDALVWAVTELLFSKKGEGSPLVHH